MLLIWLCPCIALGAIGRPLGSALARDDAASHRAIDGYIAAKMRSARIPGLALAIVRGDRIVYLKGYGRADASGRHVTPQTPFLIGSITKSFTALAVMQLVEAGTVDLDAPVQRYIPWFRVADPKASAQITVRHLLTMTSGLPQSYVTQLWTEQDDRALERTVRLLETARLSHPVGESYSYSNANYETLGLIVQTVSGRSYEEYVKERIFAPLDMRNSFVSQEEAMRHGMASGYRWWFGIPVPATLPYKRAELPAGYIISTAEDMSHYLVAQMNAGRYGDTSVLSPDGIALTHFEPAPGRYGMGWESVRLNGRRLINHDGGTANFQSSLFFDPDARIGVVILANVINALDAFSSPHGSSPLDGQTTRAMAQTVLSLATKQPLPSTGPGHELLTLLFDLAILALTGALVMSLARVRGRHRRLAQRGIATWSDLAGHSGLAAVSNFALPAAVLYLSLNVPAWKVIVLFQPDLGYWLDAVALVLFLKGLLELALLGRVFSRTRYAPAVAH
jgi:CubicO group peptidase (beta-lactamase class C family)